MTNCKIATYNKKAFLLPDSINSAAIYHALIEAGGVYRFRIHDCRSAVRLHGNLTDHDGPQEAVAKLRRLAAGATEFADFIESNYLSV